MRRNIRCFVEEAHKRGFNTCLAGETAIIPVLVGRDEDAFLLSNMLRICVKMGQSTTGDQTIIAKLK